MKKLILLSLVLVGLSSCKKAPQETVQSGNFEVEYLFEKDGCKAYRFLDGGTYIYYTDCSGKTEYTRTIHSGKTHYTQKIQSSTSK